MNDANVSAVGNAWLPSFTATLIATLLGGAIGLGIIMAIDPVFAFPNLPPVPEQPTDRDLELIQKHITARGQYFSYNYALEFAILGGILAAAIGFCTCRSRKIPSAIVGASAAAIAGGVSGLLSGKPIGEAIEQSQGFTLTQAGMFHWSVWGAMTIAMAVAIGWVQGGFRQAVQAAIAGAVASILAVLLYLVAASVIFLSDNLAHLIPLETNHRGFWIASCAILFAVGFTFAMRPSKPKAAAEDALATPTE